MKRECLFGFVVVFLFFALSGCGSQAEYNGMGYHVEAAPIYIGIEMTPEDTAIDETEMPGHISSETTPLALDISLPIFQEVVYRDGLIHIKDNDGRWGLLDYRGNVLVAPERGLTFGRYGEGRILAATGVGSAFGFIDALTGEWAIPPYFSARSHDFIAFHDGVAVIYLVDDTRGVINLDGEWIFGPAPRGTGITSQAHHGLLRISRHSYQDNQGRWVSIPPDEDARPFLINTAVERVFPLEHMEIYHYDGSMSISIEGCNLVRVGTGAGRYTKLFDLDGNMVARIEDDYTFNHMSIFVQGDVIIAYYTDVLCQVLVDSTMEFRVFDMQGNEITNRYYTSMGRFVDGFAPVEAGRPRWVGDAADWNDLYDWDNVFWGLIDMQGNEVIPPIYWHVSNVTHGLVQVYSSDGFALLNTSGEYIIPFGEFGSIGICNQGVVIVGIGGPFVPPSNQLKGLVDLEGNEIIPPRYNIIRSYWTYDHIHNGWEYLLLQAGIRTPALFGWDESIIQEGFGTPTFVDGRAAVAYDGLWGYIDMNGYEVIPLQFTYAGTFIDGMALVNVGGTRARPDTWQTSWGSHIADTRHYSAFGGTWHIIDLYGNILETFEHEFMMRVSANILAFSNDVSLSEVYDRYSHHRREPPHIGGRYTLLWDDYGFIDAAVADGCIYITLVQMDIENLGVIVIEP